MFSLSVFALLLSHANASPVPSQVSQLQPRQYPAGYFCNENTGRGYFRVYNLATSQAAGCLDDNARWVLNEAECAVFNTDPDPTG
jgi:hypothetical protein